MVMGSIYKHVTEASEPLLPRKQQDEEGGEFEEFEGASFAGAVSNLSTTIVGAGIMLLPTTMLVLGLVPGLAAVVFAALPTDASIDLLMRYSRAASAESYAEAMGNTFGALGRGFDSFPNFFRAFPLIL